MRASRRVSPVENALAAAVALVVVLLVGCGQRKPDLYGRETEDAWTGILREEMREALSRQGYATTDAQQAPRILYPERAWTTASTVSVIFTDEREPPQVVGSAQFRPVDSQDGMSWELVGLVVAAGEGGSLNTFLAEQTQGEPDVTSDLDSYLSKCGMKRQKLGGALGF